MKQRKSYDVSGNGGAGEDIELKTDIKKSSNGELADVEFSQPGKFIEGRDTDKVVELKRSVTLINGVAIIVGSIIGSGIFLTPTDVYVYGQDAYVAIVIWCLSGVFSLIGAICFAELGTCITRSGGDYVYILEAFGPFPAFLTLWVTILVIRPVTAAVVALTFGQYVVKPFFMGDIPQPDYAPQLLAAVCLCLLTAINAISIKLAMKIQDLFTAGKLIALIAVIITGFVYLILGAVGTRGYDLSGNTFQQPFDFEGKDFNYIALSLSFYNGLFAYAGWNYLNFVTQELKDPYKNLPRAIWIGLPLVTVIYVLTNVAYFIVLPPDELRASAAVAVAFGARTFGTFQWVIPIFVALSTFGGVNGTLFSSARLFFAGAEDGQLPNFLAFVHVRKFTPVPALLLQCIIAILYLLTGSIGTLIKYVSFVLWVSTGVAVAALLRLRKTKPNLHRPIKVNLILPVLYILCTIIIVIISVVADPFSTGCGCLITLTGVPVYMLTFWWIPKKTKSGQSTGCFADFTKTLQKLLNVIPQEKSETLL